MKKVLLIVAVVATCAIHSFDSVQTGEPVIDGKSTTLEPGGDDGPIPPPKPPCPGCPG